MCDERHLLRSDPGFGGVDPSPLNWEKEPRAAAAVSVRKRQGLLKLLHRADAANDAAGNHLDEKRTWSDCNLCRAVKKKQ